MTYLDKDQVLALLEALHDSPDYQPYGEKEDGREAVWECIELVRSIAALPAIPLDRECSDDVYNCSACGTAGTVTSRHNFESPSGALPALETKKETPLEALKDEFVHLYDHAHLTSLDYAGHEALDGFLLFLKNKGVSA